MNIPAHSRYQLASLLAFPKQGNVLVLHKFITAAWCLYSAYNVSWQMRKLSARELAYAMCHVGGFFEGVVLHLLLPTCSMLQTLF